MIFQNKYHFKEIQLPKTFSFKWTLFYCWEAYLKSHCFRVLDAPIDSDRDEDEGEVKVILLLIIITIIL